MLSDDFVDLRLGIATAHGKENQIGPVFQDAFGVKICVPTTLPTDSLGTFSGDVDRIGSPVEVARKKIELAHSLLPEVPLWVASEGSFGPHPSIGFLPSDEEWLVFQDVRTNLEVVARVVSLSTNYRAEWITSEETLESWANEVLFPSHALVLASSQTKPKRVVKGIQEEIRLRSVFLDFFHEFGGAWVMTDMRAMMNPTRQEVIREAAEVLIQKIASKCPSCQSPGYSIHQTSPGLPCSWCGLPTATTLEATWLCTLCQYSHTQRFPQGREVEDPGLCDYCNP